MHTLYIKVLITESSTCFEHPSVHPQEDLYMQFYGVSFKHPYKQCGPAFDQTACMDAWKKYHKISWGWTLGCSNHVEDTIIKLKH